MLISMIQHGHDFAHVTTHYNDVIMSTIASQITSLAIVYSTVYSGAFQRKHQSSASLAFVWGIHRGPVNSPHKRPVTRKMFPFDDVIMNWAFVAFTKLCHELIMIFNVYFCGSWVMSSQTLCGIFPGCLSVNSGRYCFNQARMIALELDMNWQDHHGACEGTMVI